MDLDLNNLSLENDSQETFEKILNAFSKGETKKIEKMLENVEKNLVINETDSDGRTLLHLTGAEFIFENIWLIQNRTISIADRCAIAKMLIQNGANVNAVDKNGLTPLYFAVKNNKVDLARILLDHGANIEALSMYGETPLHHAAKANFIDMAALLLQNGANVNAVDNGGETPLFWGVRYKLVNMAKLLTHFGANVDAREFSHLQTPLTKAFYAGTRYNEEIVQALICDSTKTSMEIAMKNNKSEMLKAIMFVHM